MDRLLRMKETLIGVIEGQMTHLECVDAKELGEAIDMVKDLSEAIYYCTVTEAMESGSREGWSWESDYEEGRMYYGGKSGHNGDSRAKESGHHTGTTHAGGTRHNSEREVSWGEVMHHDQREGRSPMSRKAYMESKENHKDKAVQMQELEKYSQELASDLVEMIEGASPEEKQYLSNRIAALAAKIK